MAAHTHSTPTTPTPIVDLTTPRKAVEDALYDIGVITHIVEQLATVMISVGDQVCGTAFDFLAKQLNERQETITELIATGSFGRGG